MDKLPQQNRPSPASWGMSAQQACLELVKCSYNCKSSNGCGTRCGCKKANWTCTEFCKCNSGVSLTPEKSVASWLAFSSSCLLIVSTTIATVLAISVAHSCVQSGGMSIFVLVSIGLIWIFLNRDFLSSRFVHIIIAVLSCRLFRTRLQDVGSHLDHLAGLPLWTPVDLSTAV